MTDPAIPSTCKARSGTSGTVSASRDPWIRFSHSLNKGVFAEKHFTPGQLIENSPVLVIPDDQWSEFSRSFISGFCCQWGANRAMVVGYVPFYHQSEVYNARLVQDIKGLALEIFAIRDISMNEEIVLDRNTLLQWHTPDETALEGVLFSGQGHYSPEARELGCQKAECQALALDAQRRRQSGHSPHPLQQSMNLPLVDGTNLELVPVPFGVFDIGGLEQDEELYPSDKPQHKRFLDDYYIGKYPVTVRQFAAFVAVTHYLTTAEQCGSGWVNIKGRWKSIQGADWRHPSGPQSDVNGKADHPVTQVSWHDARAFCRWAGEVTGQKVGLPSEWEWEKAARGTDARLWPWGNEPPDATRCNYDNNVGDTTPAGQYSPCGDGPYHCADMAGNVWEWTDSILRLYPYEDDETRGEGTGRILRGGAFHQARGWMRCAGRYWYWLDEHLGCLGFRVRVLPKEVGDAAS